MGLPSSEGVLWQPVPFTRRNRMYMYAPKDALSLHDGKKWTLLLLHSPSFIIIEPFQCTHVSDYKETWVTVYAHAYTQRCVELLMGIHNPYVLKFNSQNKMVGHVRTNSLCDVLLPTSDAAMT